MVTNSRQFITGLAVLALLLIGAFCAEAQIERKIYPGTLCTALGFGNESRLLYFNRGDVCNVTLGTVLTVSCPVVRDNPTGTWLSVIVTFEDNNPDLDGNPHCSAISFTPERGFVRSPITAEPLPDATGITTIQFGRPMESNPEGSYFLSCDLPPSVCLHFYRVVEPVEATIE